MAKVAAEAGVKRSSLYSAFIKPYPRMEKVIADAVGLSPQDLFPERYDDAGLPNRRMGRPYKSATKSAKNTTRTAARNINNRKVA